MLALAPDELAASQQKRDALLVERTYLREGLERSALVERVWPSDTNFLMIDCLDAARFMEKSIAGGLIVRDLRAHPLLPRSLRVSIGTRAQNDALLNSVGSI